MSAGSTPRTRIRRAAVVLLAALAGALILMIPEDVRLGNTLSLVLTHGASVWVNLMTYTGATIAAILFLARRRDGAYDWARSFRYFSLVYWIVNAVMGVWAARITWGAALSWQGLLAEEPRLQMTVAVLLAAVLAFGIDFALGKRLVSAGVDVVFGIGLWVMVLTTRLGTHPDSPVFNEGTDPLILILFLSVSATLAAIAGLIVWEVRDRFGRTAA